MAVIRTYGPVGRVRSERFGGGSRGSAFQGSVTINTSGLTNIATADFSSDLGKLVRDKLETVKDKASDRAPKRTGELASSGEVVIENEGETVSGKVRFNANHAAPVEYGAQGRAPNPFLRSSWDEELGGGRGVQEIKQGLSEIIASKFKV